MTALPNGNPAASSYALSGFSHRMGWGARPALLLVDVCKAYFTEGSPLSLLPNPEAVATPNAMRRLVAAARKARSPVVWSKIEYSSPDMADAGLWLRKAKLLDVWLKGDPRGLEQALDGLSPQEGDVVVVKKFASAFFDTPLADKLQVVGAACGDRTSQIQNSNLFDLDAKDADVVEESEAISHLETEWT